MPTTVLTRSKRSAELVNDARAMPVASLAGIALPASVRASTDAADALAGATLIIHAVPVQSSRGFLKKVCRHVPAGCPVLCTSKGIEVKTLKLMAEILPETLGRERAYAFLSGPSFAKEIALGMATAVVVASEDARLARDISRLVSSDTFRVFTSRDVVGLEVGGAVKNVIALAAGMCEGLSPRRAGRG